MILVSACLIGINCKYSGDNNENEEVKEYLKGKDFTLVCPEQLGGLSTPRPPAEIVDGKVITKEDNKDVTENFVRGAEETLKIARLYVCSEAILKEGSPSCGCNLVYDGSFSGKKIPGKGITAKLLEEEGIKVKSEKDL
ncbi:MULTISPECIES: DUF523 domain-containing protein [unclassified Clostridioides]|uniref:DUF523 domain-containing protein n=1 Tax=unclassified Clostridioides TaxID=2635829 RepID=UPI001D0C2BC8|nr:DUF523 domain-containing protein [Clostridioides sp. ES-S-0001-02]MCC0640812.1 DUF523 domain-containing protein [Clostridioides sp. ES-S-0049-03]MCC0653354.1 DUF523 domain-containing protein [Clostridioides sp. ES-S-0001-03]MCC0656637.1 DUF523 domain-containing protein [Clostridioides sp. ES-S-0123-01]MCC0672028.1 DUF523 domain-containing protein [Clostridioides sp. ES-S-0145-01]MCC0676018.1 DUF523 domain-containing protein [Clostridioides sp. ES-W-0018-02]MCC0681349.1 DUF523 domain-contai